MRSARRAAGRAWFVYLAGALCVVLAGGCAARNPAAGRAPSPPMQPAETPISTEEAAKRDTNVAPEPVPTPVPTRAPLPKRYKGGAEPPPEGYAEEGNASWYGEPFNGRRSSNGEIFDMRKLTAAHRTFPFDTMVRVTNLENGKSTVVRITDRGPFVGNRIIDLSQAAAREIESIGHGVVRVRLEVVSAGIDPTSGFFTVQVGAFRERANAERLRDRLSARYSPVLIQEYESPEGTLYRVRVGKVSGEDAAQELGEQLRGREGLTPTIVRLDDAGPAGSN